MDRQHDISSSTLPSSELPEALANESVAETCERVPGQAPGGRGQGGSERSWS